ENRAAFERKRGEHGEDVLEPLGGLEAAMRQQAVVANPDAQAGGNPPENDCEKDCLPTEEEKSRHCANVKQDHESGCYPVHFVICFGVSVESFEVHVESLSRFLLLSLFRH